MKRKRTLEDFFGVPDKSIYRGLEKVISGGQIGADQAALRAAETIGIETGGTAPYAYMTSNGSDITLKTRYGLRETSWKGTPSLSYVSRSKQNVDDGDATLVFSTHISTGTAKTIGYCETGEWKVLKKKKKTKRVRRIGQDYHRPYFVIDTMDGKKIYSIIETAAVFIVDYRVHTLNVAGHRSDPNCPNFGRKVQAFLERVFARVSQMTSLSSSVV